MQWTGTFAQFVLDLERKINDYDQVAEEDERYDEKKKKDSLKQAILGCPDLVSLEMFENLHRQKYGRPMACKKYRAMVMDKTIWRIQREVRDAFLKDGANNKIRSDG